MLVREIRVRVTQLSFKLRQSLVNPYRQQRVGGVGKESAKSSPVLNTEQFVRYSFTKLGSDFASQGWMGGVVFGLVEQ